MVQRMRLLNAVKSQRSRVKLYHIKEVILSFSVSFHCEYRREMTIEFYAIPNIHLILP